MTRTSDTAAISTFSCVLLLLLLPPIPTPPGLCLFAVHANKTFDGSTWRQPAVVVGIGNGVLPARRSLLTYAAASISSTVH